MKNMPQRIAGSSKDMRIEGFPYSSDGYGNMRIPYPPQLRIGVRGENVL